MGRLSAPHTGRRACFHTTGPLASTDDTTGGANLGLYAGILLILGGGGSLAAIAATRRNRD